MDASPGRLLVVDDDENNRDMLSRRLQRRGFGVETAEDGRQALAAIARTPFDLVLLDIEMPGMNGFEVLEKVRETQSAVQLPIIIATARGDREDVLQALALGANDYVTKPIDFPVVLARVETQLSHKRVVDRIVELEADVRKRNAELQTANARMTHSLAMAARIQRSLLPDKSLNEPGVRFAWLFEPCDELGGDILNLLSLGGGKVAMYLLDVSGHGVSAALLSVTFSRMLSIVPDQETLVHRPGPTGMEPRPPRDVAAELNRRFQMSGWDGQYFTLFYGVIDAARRQLRYVSAGHPPALVLPAVGPPRFLECHNLAIGWFPETEYEEGIVDLEPGDRLYVYSDGITEMMNAGGEAYGREKFEAICARGRADDLEKSLHALTRDIGLFRGNEAVADDVSSLAMEML